MDRKIFSKQHIKNALAEINTLKVDITHVTPEEKALLARYKIIGAPAILYIDTNGIEKRNLRVTGLINEAEFSQRLNELQQAK